jgi:hypothetical protein
MNKARWLIASLMLCVGVFLFPITAFADAAPDTVPPEVAAYLDGELLRITAKDDNSGVEAVYVGGKRVICNENATLVLTFDDYADDTGSAVIYAVDFVGNESETVIVTKPESENTDEPTESSIPESTKPLTPDGTGTVLDHVVVGDKEFFTIQTADENVFYLIIDHARDTQNVYFLNVVTEDDLYSLAGSTKPGTTNESAIPGETTSTVKPSDEPQTETPEPTSEPETPKKSNMGTVVFMLIAVIILGGVGYYFKILKPEKERAMMDDEDDEDEDDEEYVNEDDYSDEDDGHDSDYFDAPADDGNYEFEPKDKESVDTEEVNP